MLTSVVLAIFAATRVVFAGPVNPAITSRACGSEISQEQVKAFEEHFNANRVRSKFSKTAEVTIPVNFHVISKGDNTDEGNIPDSWIDDQMEVLRKDFEGSGLNWRLENITRTTNADWYDLSGLKSDAQTQMKKELREGVADTLNVFTVGSITTSDGQALGYATFPKSYDDEPENDGVVVLYSSLPGSSAEPYNLGKTLTHEVGHWVGLYHTFQGGCDGGDMVDDTPPEKSAATGCDEGRDTCPADQLPDPIHNYMDYSDDSCLTEFTPGQIERLQDQIATYRGIDV